ncbi:MAG: sigma-54 dependent transcriptional regulator [Melioribacter sp.]|uniref:sigma-54-dependent transcriptional regulator n=1 Tax=Rosettibacter primus TaxID=3111523 RepID=UPI00247DCA39|nr:sigma-54 dependent transcriptional regulator [Melioribacter sp.]
MQLNKQINILLIEDESYDVNRIKKTLAPFSEWIKIKNVVADGQSAVELVSNHENEFDVIIMDYQIVGPLTGEKLIRKIKSVDPFIQIIVITKMTINVTDFDFANKLIEAGAMWFCTKYPSDVQDYVYQPTDLLLSILNAYEKKRLSQEKAKSNIQLNQSINNILNEKKIIGESTAVKNLIKQIEKAAMKDATVLIYGASGTGKELVATHIHYLSKRKYENFVTVNAGSIPSELIESELFGFEKGSFTGAMNAKKGLFEIANNGTIFLDEIAELSMSSQVKLLRVLQDGEIDKIGRTGTMKVDVRVIAATNIDLEKAVEEKRFREDLYYRLNVINIYTPKLNERIEDIPLLTDYFIKKYSAQMDIPVPEIKKDAIEILQSYEWPGNIRQLQNVIQRLLISCENVITKEDVLNILDVNRIRNLSEPEFWFGNKILKWRDMERLFRCKYFAFVKEKTKSESEAARLLGMAPSNFYRMCNKLGIKNTNKN